MQAEDNIPATTTDEAPDWLTFEGELLCPLCDYNLRGLSQPRCPECGHRSTWGELRERLEKHPYLIEYYPLRSARSWARTIWGSLWPQRFWTQLSPAMSPKLRRIILFAVVVVFFGLIFSLSNPAPALVRQAAQNAIIRQSLVQRYTRAPNSIMTIPAAQAMANQRFPPATSMQFWIQFFQSGMFSRRSPAVAVPVALLIVLWMPFTMLSLMLFRESMQQARIRSAHVLRCVVYSGSVLAVYPLVSALVLVTLIPIQGLFNWQILDAINFSFLAIFLLLIVLLPYRLAVAYRQYLRFDHAVLTVLSSQIIVALAIWRFHLLLNGF